MRKHNRPYPILRARQLSVIAATFAVVLVTVAGVASTDTDPRRAPPSGITWARDAKDSHWVQGQVDVASAPDAVWTRVSDVPNWPKLLSDVKWLKVLEKGKDRWRIKLETRSFECGAHEYDVALRGGNLLTFEIDAPGIDSKARVLVRPGASAGQANIVYSLYVRATGIVGWFVSEKELRRRQEAMVIRALTDLQRAFGPAPSGKKD